MMANPLQLLEQEIALAREEAIEAKSKYDEAWEMCAPFTDTKRAWMTHCWGKLQGLERAYEIMTTEAESK